MKLSVGIVGLPNVGKSTLFKILTKKEVNIANYPFATIDPNVGIVEVKDERLYDLAKVSRSLKVVPAVVEFYDIAGLVKGAYKGEGLGNQFLAHIRNVEVIVHIVRCFKEETIVHIEGRVDPLKDLKIIELELIFKDLETIEKRLKKIEAESRSGDKKAKLNLEILNKAKKILENEKLLTDLKDEEIIKELQLLTAKPQLILLNGSSENIDEDVIEEIKRMGFDYFIADLYKTEDLTELINLAYRKLGLISFFTTGEDETRAWTIKAGTKAPQAAGVIHTDFEKNFIKAEVINWKKLIEAGGWTAAKQKGLIKIEGKDYVVKDGDVLVIKHGA